jgi:hypothetical protein
MHHRFACTVVAVFLLSANAIASEPCPRSAAILLGRAFTLGAPVRFTPEQGIAHMVELNDGAALVKLVVANRDDFRANSDVVRCAARVGAIFQHKGISAYDPEPAPRTMASIPPELGMYSDELAARVNEGAVQWMVLGDYLSWLTNVLPQIAEGDHHAYFDAGSLSVNGLRQQAIAVRQGMDFVCRMDPQMCSEIEQYMYPQLQQIAAMSRQYDEVMELLVLQTALR